MIGFAGASVCIVGMGLMGASAAQRIHGRCKKLIGVDINPEVIAFAINQGWIDEGFSSFSELESTPDLVILSVPVKQILAFLDGEAHKIRSSCMIVDFGSTKQQIISKMEQLPAHILCYACHPMCGKEISGPQSSDARLYENRSFLYHGVHIDAESDQVLFSMIDSLGAQPVPLDAGHHDRQLAYVSHVPHLLAASLMLVSGSETYEEKETLWKIAASGFQDMTRLAGSDITMIQDILATNDTQISLVLGQVIDNLSEIKEMLDKGELEELKLMLSQARKMKESANQWRKL
jgi:prephenate dehydrogenase